MFLCSVLVPLLAQNKTLVSERIFLAPTNTYYGRNDTVQVIGQVLSTEYTDFYPYSRYVYLEMSDKDNKLVLRQKVKCDEMGRFYATMPLETKVENGMYHLRGYTQFMRNRKNAFYPMVPLFVGSRPAVSTDNNKVKTMFFPEGGHLVSGVTQNLGVYLCNDINQSLETRFWVLKNDKDTIFCGNTTRSGLATIGFVPQANANYTLQTSHSNQSFKLPETEDAPTLQAVVHKGRLVCKVLSAEGGEDTLKERLFAYHSSFGLREMTLDKGMAIADVSGCTPGVLTLWLTDGQYSPIAQRVLWIGSVDSTVQLHMKSTYRPGEQISSLLKDTVPGSQVFVRIVPDWDRQSVSALSMLDFSNELSSPLPFPACYLDEEETAKRKDLASWLLSARQVMIDADFLQKDSVSYPYPVEAGLCVAGSISQSHRPLSNAKVQLYNTSTNEASTATTDANGHFEAPVYDYIDGTKLYMQAYNEKGKVGNYLYKLDEYSFPSIVNTAAYRSFAEEVGGQPAVVSYNTRFDSAKTYHIDEVVIARKAVNKKQYEWVRNRSYFNYFDRRFLEEKPNLLTLKDIVMYTNQVLVSYDNNAIYWRNPRYNTLSTPKVHPADDAITISQIALVVNGLKIDYNLSDFLTMPATDIESVELVKPLDPRAMFYDAANGMFEVKMRYMMKKEELSSNGITIQPLGISVPSKPYEMKMPGQEGRYKVLVDVVSPNRQINSFVREIEVKR